MLPAVALLVAFVIAPGVYALILSFQTRHVSGGLLGTTSETVFAGTANYRNALGDGTLWSGLAHMLLMAAITIPLTIGFALLFALCLDSARAKLTRFTRLSIFLPYAVPGVIATLLWGFLYLPATSPIGGNHVNFFGQVMVFFSVGNVALWGAVGFNMVVMFTALRALPRDIYDAAKIDGCTEWQIAIHVKIPLLRPALLMCTPVHRARRAAALQRAEHVAATGQRHLHHLGAPDEDLHGRFRQLRHQPRRRHLGAVRGGGAGHLGDRLPPGGPALVGVVAVSTMAIGKAFTPRPGGAAAWLAANGDPDPRRGLLPVPGAVDPDRVHQIAQRTVRHQYLRARPRPRHRPQHRRPVQLLGRRVLAVDAQQRRIRADRRHPRCGGVGLLRLRAGEVPLPRRGALFNIILAGVLLPPIVLAIPQYLLLSKVGLSDSYAAVILPQLFNPYGIYLARIYANASVPDELPRSGPA